MQILEDLRIVKRDSMNFVIEELKDVESKKDGVIRKEWLTSGYYGTLKQALIGCRKRVIDRGISCKDITELLDYLNNFEQLEIKYIDETV